MTKLEIPSGYTPGKWVNRGAGCVSAEVPQTSTGSGFTVTTSLTPICVCSQSDLGTYGGSDEDEANAALIALAPALAAEYSRLYGECERLREARDMLRIELEAADQALWEEGFTTNHPAVAAIVRARTALGDD